ncbi:MAG: HAD family hydrolase [Proteobacteria bacterium]|nr:HAD family hydrolase [Pseudomonadota bacterium]MDA0952239.1 HAD family hydrolase [Pseudomonadota bacterium]
MSRRVDWVVFDVGGTLVDETRMWRIWAQRIGVSEAHFLEELDEVLAARLHHREVFARLAPELDVAAAERAEPFRIARGDFFDDALPALEALAARGFQVAVAANQPEVTEAILLAEGLPLAFALSSDRAGVAKPDPAFFARIREACGVPAERIAYVGDRIDNDVVPANAAGMLSVFLPRGPWGHLHADWPESAQACMTVERLTDLVKVLASA